MDLHVFRSPESENQISTIWSLCPYVCLCVCLLIKDKVVAIEPMVLYQCMLFDKKACNDA